MALIPTRAIYDMTVRVKCTHCGSKWKANINSGNELIGCSTTLTRSCPHCTTTNQFDVERDMTSKTVVQGRE